MAAKGNYLLSFNDKQNNDTINDQYTNFTLNKNHQFLSSDKFSERSKNFTTEKRKALDYEEIRRTAASTKLSDFENNISQTKKKSQTWKKSTKDLSSIFLNNDSEQEDDDGLKKRKHLSSSTLSLHIEAYENSNDTFYLKKERLKENDKKRKEAKQIDMNLTSGILNTFEFPRQQESGETILPEIAQYKASQQLLNPNQHPAGSSTLVTVLFVVSLVLCLMPIAASTSTWQPTTTNNEISSSYDPFIDTSDETISNFTCSNRYRYSMPLIEFTKDLTFMFPLILLLIEILGLLILRSILAFYVFRRRSKKIYLFTHPPILDERYFDDPPPYAVTKP